MKLEITTLNNTTMLPEEWAYETVKRCQELDTKRMKAARELHYNGPGPHVVPLTPEEYTEEGLLDDVLLDAGMLDDFMQYDESHPLFQFIKELM